MKKKERIIMGDKTVIGTVLVPVEVTIEDIGYILAGCFEGGSNYWIDKVEVIPNAPESGNGWFGESHARDVPGAGGIIEITTEPVSGTVNEGHHQGTQWFVTKNKMVDGLKLYYEKSNNKLAIEDMDVFHYDAVLQYAIFGVQVFA